MYVWRLKKQIGFKDSSSITMDETSVWNDMVSSTSTMQAGAKGVSLKTTGHKKVQVLMCPTGKWDGTKLKSFIAFAGAKWDTKSLQEEFKSQYSVALGTIGWKNEDVLIRL